MFMFSELSYVNISYRGLGENKNTYDYMYNYRFLKSRVSIFILAIKHVHTLGSQAKVGAEKGLDPLSVQLTS